LDILKHDIITLKLSAVAWKDCLMLTQSNTSNKFTISLELVLTHAQLEKNISDDVFVSIACLYPSTNCLKLKKIYIYFTFWPRYRSTFVASKGAQLITIFNKDLTFSFSTSGYIVEDLDSATRPSPWRNIN